MRVLYRAFQGHRLGGGVQAFDRVEGPVVAHIERYRSVTKWDPGGPTIRLHIGLEDPDDLIADLERGFASMQKA